MCAGAGVPQRSSEPRTMMDPRLGMEFRDRTEMGDGMSVDTHMMNTEHGGRECSFVNMPDPTPENIAALSENMRTNAEAKEKKKWAARD